MAKNGTPCCRLIEPGVVQAGDRVVLVMQFTKGRKIEMTEADAALMGGWIKTFHDNSRKFAKEHPEAAAKFVDWDKKNTGKLKLD